MKNCSKCGQLKPLSDFYRAGASSRAGRRGDCIACNLAAKSERHKRDPHPARERSKRWRDANPDRAAINQRTFVASGGT